MTRVRRSRRRYLLLMSSTPFTGEMKNTLIEYLEESHRISRKSIVWLGDHAIIRTDHELVKDLRPVLEGWVCRGAILRTVAVSGAIGKLKRLVGGSKVVKLGEIPQ